ncbi:hypothetical protein QBC33DRAFT_542615 [Phialemonium atrogriseum]|uniref:Uncharacterized protein n=1 Tax=Phialemonium atrogriseum TaxID=1093897 RepID=A0AAJ0BWM7_9PEZI|nr:uncharacterized protein QBC33DRAFT_542615 [Phialemonium atrogriseum]KAK1765830.1 hypothetical protein QBC33DRAFT_542615 [Phialemonium atrogriseum]
MEYFTLSGLLFLIFWAQPSYAMTFTIQFQHWYPQYAPIWKDILQTNCTDQYALYLTGFKNHSNIDWRGGGGTLSALTQPVILCILNNSSDYLQSVLTSAQVLLGITPTVLALLSASNEELAMLTVVARRPMLASLLALGSPSVYLSRAFDYCNPKDILEGKNDRLTQWRPAGAAKSAVAMAEYVLAIAAVGNVAHVSYQLGIRSVSSIWSDTVLGPMIWALLVIVIHVVGTLSMCFRVRRDMGNTRGIGGSVDKGPIKWLRNTWWFIRELPSTEMTPSVAQSDMEVTFIKESPKYIIVSWFLSPFIICHIIFGTFLMSSLLFLGPKDALGVAGRYMGSVLVCRTILLYEIAGMREMYLRSKESKESAKSGVTEGLGGAQA